MNYIYHCLLYHPFIIYLNNTYIIVYKIPNNKKIKRNKSVVIPSYAELEERVKVMNTDINDLLNEYVNLPFLPIGENINIDKIGVYNNDFTNDKTGNNIKYKMLTSIDSKNYPVGVNPQLDYMPEDNVSPVVIIDTKGKKYKTKIIYWVSLTDISNRIMIKQATTGVRVLPYTFLIDDISNNNGNDLYTWIFKLMNIL